MIKVEQSNGLPCNLWITPNMEEFVKKIDNHNLEFSVGLIEAGYHSAQHGMFGYTGPTRIDKLPTDLYPENYLVLRINFKTDLEEQVFNELRNSLIITPGGRNNRYNPVRYNKVYNWVKQDYQLYHWKKPGYGELVRIMTEMDIEDLLYKLEDHIIIKNRDANYSEDLLKVETRSETVNMGLLYNEVTITLLSQDLSVNLDHVLKVI